MRRTFLPLLALVLLAGFLTTPRSSQALPIGVTIDWSQSFPFGPFSPTEVIPVIGTITNTTADQTLWIWEGSVIGDPSEFNLGGLASIPTGYEFHFGNGGDTSLGPWNGQLTGSLAPGEQKHFIFGEYSPIGLAPLGTYDFRVQAQIFPATAERPLIYTSTFSGTWQVVDVVPLRLYAPETLGAAEGERVTFDVTVGGADGNPIAALDVSELPLGATFSVAPDKLSGRFDWTPDFAQAGAYTVQFQADDGLGQTASAATLITIRDVNRPPTGNPGGPYNGTVGNAIAFDGSHSSDPDGEVLTFAWDFGDGNTGSGANPSHTYSSMAGSPYTVTLTVSDGSLSSAAATTATVRDFVAARVFYPLSLNYIFPQILPTWVWIEPINGSFAISDVIVSSVSMSYNGQRILTGCKSTAGGDRDHNGVPEIRVCFARNDLRTLFASLSNGTSNVTVTLQGDLASGGKFQGTTLVHVIKLGFLGAGSMASVSPNPLNPQAKLTFVTTQPGVASVQVFDLNGRLVRTLMTQQSLSPGIHEVTVDGRNEQGNRLASGVYYYRVQSADGVSKGTLVMLK